MQTTTIGDNRDERDDKDNYHSNYIYHIPGNRDSSEGRCLLAR